MYNNIFLEGLINDFSKLNEVEAILLAGSKASGTDDKDSDFDVYIYANSEIDLSKRKEISEKYCSMMELNNQYWETEDDGILNDGTPIELIYRNFDFIKDVLNSVVLNENAWIGYTTCFWANFTGSKILFDRNGKAQELIKKYNVDYPQGLKLNIIRKNYELLRDKSPAYYFQIEKALKRNDLVSINHRVSALFESYFDILFAVNEIKHPGEKKMVAILKKEGKHLPESFEEDINAVLCSIPLCNQEILDNINTLIDHLDQLFRKLEIKL